MSEEQDSLSSSRKESTRYFYWAKWKRFASWTQWKVLSPEEVDISLLLDYFLSLKISGLALNSLKVHIVAVNAFHPPMEGHSVFMHPLTTRFREDLLKTFPPIAPLWDFNLVLLGLMKEPLEPLASCSMPLLSMKVTFFVAIASARRIEEL